MHILEIKNKELYNLRPIGSCHGHIHQMWMLFTISMYLLYLWLSNIPEPLLYVQYTKVGLATALIML